MLFATFVLSSLVALSFQQSGPSYECTEGHCSSNTYNTRQDVLGCLDFCNTDRDGSLSLSRDEYHSLYDDCLTFSISGLCDEAAAYLWVPSFLPVCNTETAVMYQGLCGLDGDCSSISMEDTDAAYNSITNRYQEEPIGRDTYRAYYNESYPTWADPECTVPYP